MFGGGLNKAPAAGAGFNFGSQPSTGATTGGQPNIFGNSQSTGQTTSNALAGASNTYAVPSMEMPASLTSKKLKRRRSNSHEVDGKSVTFLEGRSTFNKLHKVESVSGLFSSSRCAIDGQQTTKKGTAVVESDYRRLVVRNPRDAYKNYAEIDPNKVLLKDVHVLSSSTKSARSVSDFRPAKKQKALPTPQSVKLNLEKETGYWSSPSVQELSTMSTDALSAVQFTAGRRGHGQVRFNMAVDLSGFQNDWDDLLGKTIVFQGKTLQVYHGEDKPSVGNGLNVPATVTIDSCFPKKNGELVKDPEAPEMARFVVKLHENAGMEFINYDPITGAYTFIVQHFSIWGIVDEDDDPEVITQFNKQQEKEKALQTERQIVNLKADQGVGEWTDLGNEELVQVRAYEPEPEDIDMEALKPAQEYPISKDWDSQLQLSAGFHSVFNNNLARVKNLPITAESVNDILYKDKSLPRRKKAKTSFEYASQYCQCLDMEIKSAKFEPGPHVAFDESIDLEDTLKAFKGTPLYEYWRMLAILLDDSYVVRHLTPNDSELVSPRLIELKRKDMFCSWLQSLSSTGTDIYGYVCADRLGDAAKLAVSEKKGHLAVLLSMADSNDPTVRSLAASQLKEWNSSATISLIPVEVVRVYKLLAGEIDTTGLDWSTGLFLRVKYGGLGLEETISELGEGDNNYYDLLKALHGSDVSSLPVELQFLLVKKLNSRLGIESEQACSGFAKKLEDAGMYKEAIFVLEHLKDGSEQIADVVGNHIEELGILLSDAELHRLHKSLALDLDFLNKERANKFESMEQYEAAVRSLIDANELSQAQKLTVDKVAPEYIVSNSNLDECEELLSHFKLLPDYKTNASIYAEYLELLKATDSKQIGSLVNDLLSGLPLIKQTVVRTLMYKKVVGAIFAYGLPYTESQLLALELPPSEMNYLRNKLPQGRIESA